MRCKQVTLVLMREGYAYGLYDSLVTRYQCVRGMTTFPFEPLNPEELRGQLPLREQHLPGEGRLIEPNSLGAWQARRGKTCRLRKRMNERKKMKFIQIHVESPFQ